MANMTEDDVPLVVGCGPVGLAVIASLKRKGIAPIVAADFSAKRRELALTMGADIVINPAELSPYESWLEVANSSVQGKRAEINLLTGERNPAAGVYFECVGVPGVIDQMLVGAHRGCRFVIVGVCMEQDHLRPLLAITKEINMQFVLGYTPEEFAATLQCIAQGDIPTEPLVTGKIGVNGVADAFKQLKNPELHAKILVEPWRS
jgi:threonine dehydrogenase-like Zn-dependent dehydrogenase